MVASIWLLLVPLYILAAVLITLALFALLSRFRGGKYMRPIVQFLMKLPIVGKGMRKASEAALERQNPELASAIKKLERAGAGRDPQRAQAAIGNLSAAERRAYLDAAGEQTEAIPQNRQIRRQMERAKKQRRH